MRESTKFMLLVLLGLLVGVVLVVNVSCGGSSPTNLVEEFKSVEATQSSATPTVVPSPSPVPVGDVPYIEFKRDPKDGSGTMFNPTNHAVTFTIEYFNATDFHKQVMLLAAKHVVDPKSSKALPPAKDVLKLTCGLTWDIQIDASTTSHLGHVIFQIQTDKCQECTWKELEPEVKYSEWGECKAVVTDSACTHSRTKTTTIREQNTCTDEIRIKSTREETQNEPCECKCVEEWKELPPVVTYGEWGECKKGSVPTFIEGCYQSRTKTTVISEQNSCTGAIREKSRSTDEDYQSCECKEECKPDIPSEPYCENSNPESECSYYGLSFLGKVEDGFLGPKWFGNPPTGTALVIVKAGSCQSTDNKMHALYLPPYTPNQMFMSASGKEISHITFCGCVED